ncbi:FAD/NAD(P)-binding domain-containing protein [Aspergillus insuetus]
MIIVGAGAAGLEVAYKTERQMENFTFEIFEKNDDIGGTWLENRYPGCTCDIPSHSYQWSFWRNPDWSHFYSSSEEIWRYLKDFAIKNDLEKHVKFRHRVQAARWLEQESVWQVQVRGPDGHVLTSCAEILVSCHGSLNEWRYPDIPGVQDFQGKLMHSASWDSSFDLANETVAVIGGGSSAVQIIPSIQPKVKKLIPYLRSPAWITAGFGAKYAAPGGVNFCYSDKQKEAFQDPTELARYSRDIEGELNKRFTLMHLHSTDQKVSREYVARDMRQKLGDDPLLTKHLIPDYALGCRRMTPGSDYLQSLRRDNVQAITRFATRFTSDGIIDDSGKETKVDVIICATGFHTSGPSYDIIGRDDRSLGEHWAESPKGYMSFMADGFPNMFYFIGPNGPASHGSILPVIEWLTRYMFKVISHMQRTSIKSLAPKAEAIHESYIHTHELLKRTAWSSACSSWFKNGKKHGPVTAIWPGSRLHWFEALKEPRFEDFEIQYAGNRFS